jgi:hypothetical protein
LRFTNGIFIEVVHVLLNGKAIFNNFL